MGTRANRSTKKTGRPSPSHTGRWGVRRGQAPFGTRLVSGRLEAHEPERAVIRTARSLRCRSMLRGVATRLEDQGFWTHGDRVFAPVQMARMLGPE